MTNKLEFYQKELIRGTLETFNHYLNDFENEDGLSIKSGQTMSSDSSSLSESYVELRNILAENKPSNTNHESKNKPILQSRYFNSTMHEVVQLQNKASYANYARSNLSNPQLSKQSFSIQNSIKAKKQKLKKLEEALLVFPLQQKDVRKQKNEEISHLRIQNNSKSLTSLTFN